MPREIMHASFNFSNSQYVNMHIGLSRLFLNVIIASKKYVLEWLHVAEVINDCCFHVVIAGLSIE